MSIESVMLSNHFILCHPFLLLPSIFSSIRVFFNEPAVHIRWPKDWIFSFNISPSNEYSRLISFRIDWFDVFAVQGTLKSLLQHHKSKASVLWCSDLFMVQLSHLYMTTGKNIALTLWTFFSKVMSLLFNILSRFVIKNEGKAVIVKVVIFPVVMYESESWTIKKAEHRTIDAFKLWCWKRLLRVPWVARRSVFNIHWKD